MRVVCIDTPVYISTHTHAHIHRCTFIVTHHARMFHKTSVCVLTIVDYSNTHTHMYMYVYMSMHISTHTHAHIQIDAQISFLTMTKCSPSCHTTPVCTLKPCMHAFVNMCVCVYMCVRVNVLLLAIQLLYVP